MTSNFHPATGVLALALLALLAPLPSFAIGRDLTPPQTAARQIYPSIASDGVDFLFNAVWTIDRARFYFASELPLPRRRAAP